MLEERQSAQNYFRTLLMTVVGQAYTAAGYHLEQQPLQWIAGQYRFSKLLDTSWRAYIDYQVLVYSENEYVSRMPSRFRVTLTRSNQPNGRASADPAYASRTLAQLVVADFGVQILPETDYWWQFTDTDSLGKALAEAGHLVVGYGIPWLAGDLEPPEA